VSDSSSAGVAQYPTRQVHNIAIDPLDENYFVSAGTTGDPTVTVWDQRFIKQRSSNDGAMLDFRPIVDNSHSATIWSLRYSGTKKGMFGVLANTGEFKIIELAQHSHHPEPEQSAKAETNAQEWESQLYTKVSHNLRYPYYDEHHTQESKDRVVAYDFIVGGNPFVGPSALVLHPNRDIEVLRIPPPAPRINITALEEIYRDRTAIAKPNRRQGTVADDLIEVQNKALSSKPGLRSDMKDSLTGRLDRLNLDTTHHNIPVQPATQSSHQKHEDVLTFAYPHVKLPIKDYLKVLQTQKRRTQEGYNLDCQRNRDIVANDPWLVDAWNLVERMDSHSWNDGMAGGSLDLKYLGVASIWSNELTMYDQRLIDPDAKTSEAIFAEAVKEICESKEFPQFATPGVVTNYGPNRQLCLSLCGWNLSPKGLRERCSLLIDEGQYYKAIVLAVFQGFKEVALDILKETIQAKQIENIGLGAVIACDSVNDSQRHLCAWMADMTDEPYLKGLLAYFITGDWATVIDMEQLSLTDRVGVALKYLPDDKLTHFLRLCTQETIAYGNIEGLLLTGLTNRAMDLFEHYIAKFGDLQTAVLILSRACPLYIQDPRWPLWKEIYLNQMQVWRTFLERTHYIKEHNARSISREGLATTKPSSPSVSLRCYNCQQNLALRRDSRTARSYLVPTSAQTPSTSRPARPLRPPKPKGGTTSPSLACPNCNAQMPRCGLCMMWLGSPDPSKTGAAQTLKEEDMEARLMVFCMNCTHGFHGHHARDWFSRHSMCPVPDCQCMCGLLK